MMSIKYNMLITAITTILSVLTMSGQDLSTTYGYSEDVVAMRTITDTIEIQSLTDKFYKETEFVNRTYDYELINRINRLKMMRGEVMTIGFVAGLGVMALNSVMAIEKDWSLWIDIPVATIVSIGIMYPFIKWSLNLSKKAKVLEDEASNLYSYNPTFEVGAVGFSNPRDYTRQSVGIGVKINF